MMNAPKLHKKKKMTMQDQRFRERSIISIATTQYS